MLVAVRRVSTAIADAKPARLLRAFRLFRVGRIARVLAKYKVVRSLLSAVMASYTSVFNLFFLTVFALILFAIVGMHIMHDPSDDWSKLPARNFSTFPDSILAVFQHIMLADWTLLWNYYHSHRGWGVFVYFLIVYGFCKYILGNLFMSCLIENYNASQEEKLRRQRGQLTTNVAELLRRYQGMDPALRHEAKFAILREITMIIESQKEQEAVEAEKQLEDYYKEADLVTTHNLKNVDLHKFHEMSIFDEVGGLLSPKDRSRLQHAEDVRLLQEQACDTAFGVFTRENPVRRFCVEIATSRRFDWFITICILASMVLLAIDGPQNKKHTPEYIDFGKKADMTFMIVFWVEAIVKMIALGARGYFRDGWNILDFFIVLLSTAEKAASGKGSLGRALRIGRLFRAFRLIHHVKGIQSVLLAIYYSIPDLGIVFALVFIFYMIFSILGMDLYMGTFKVCHPENESIYTGSGKYMEVIDANKDGTVADECAAMGAVYEDKGYSFNNIFASMYTLFLFAVTTDRSVIFQAALDVTDVHLQPRM